MPKKPQGRPPVREMPERIDATPQEIADVVMRPKPTTVDTETLKTDRSYELDPLQLRSREAVRQFGRCRNVFTPRRRKSPTL